MARNGSGTYTLPVGNPVVAGTTITPTWANDTLNDIATELTDSLSRSGNGGMLAVLKAVDGALGGPAFAFNNEATSGLFRAGAGDLRIAILGALVQKLTAAGVAITGTLGASGDFAINTNKFTVTAASGNTSVAGTLGVTGVTTLGGVAGTVVDGSTLELSSNTIRVKDAGVTRAKLVAVGQQISSSCGSFGTASTTYVDVTNLSVSITTTGRPVVVAVIADGTANRARLWADTTGADYQLLRDAGTVAVWPLKYQPATASDYLQVPASSLHHIDVPTAGTYTYKIQMKVQASGTSGLDYSKLIAYEL